MIIRRPDNVDWKKFLSFANDENWRVPASERVLFHGPWAECVHVLDVDGFCGMVTAVAYQKSSWIGNLIVPLKQRGKGFGTHLFKSVLLDLIEQGMTSVWLTASEQGRSIYEREGFTVVDRVERWVLSPQRGIDIEKVKACCSAESLLREDSLAWGESRTPLLPEICKAGRVFSVDGSIALLQQGQDCQILGPWYSHEARMAVNLQLLQVIVASRDPSTEIVIDSLTSSQIQPLCKAVGFQCSGQSTLMAYGNFKDVNLKNMLALASLGSVG